MPDLEIGENIINITVLAENGDTKEYELTINRIKIIETTKVVDIAEDEEEYEINEDELESDNSAIYGIISLVVIGCPSALIIYRKFIKNRN